MEIKQKYKIGLVPDTEAMMAMRNVAYFILPIACLLSDYNENTVVPDLVLRKNLKNYDYLKN